MIRTILLFLVCGIGFTLPTRAEERLVILPVTIEDEETQNLRALIDNQEVRLEAPVLLHHFENQIDRATLDKIRTQVTYSHEGQWISVRALTLSGLTANYDDAKVEVRIFVPPLLRRQREVSISGQYLPPNREQAMRPDVLSGFVNFAGAQDYSKGRQPFRGELDGALNAHSWVVEGSGSYTESSPSSWRRGDFRLVRDQPEKMIRYSVGDVIYPVEGFQRLRTLGGAAAFSQFNLQPYHLTTPISTYELFLKTRSTVKIYVNGRQIQTLQLPAGRHDLRDLPFAIGLNNVVLEIIDDVGRTEFFRIPFIFSDQLLGKGIHKVSYSIGAPIDIGSDPNRTDQRTYQGDRLTWSLSHRLGWTDSMTLGGYFQGDPLHRIGGMVGVFSSPIGIWSLEPAISGDSINGSGIGLRTAYFFATPVRNFAASVEGRGPRFAPLDEAETSSDRYDFSLGYSQQVFDQTNFLLSTNQRFFPSSEQIGGRSVSLGLARNWKSNLDTHLTFTHSHDSSALVSNTLFLLLTWSFPEKGHSVIATADSNDNQARVQWTYDPAGNAADSLAASLALERADSHKKAEGALDFTGNRSKLALTHEANFPSSVSEESSQRTSLRAASALVFSGSSLALSRPVTDSFILVKPELALKGETVELNPHDNGRYEAKSDWMGAAVIPELVSYRYTMLHLGLNQVPPGVGPIQENYLILPTYKSGLSLHVGTESFVSLKGALFDADSKPVGLWSGEIKSLTDPSWKESTFFTNSEGRFTLEGLKPGRYEVRSYENAKEKFELTVPEGAGGILDVGKIQLMKSEKGS